MIFPSFRPSPAVRRAGPAWGLRENYVPAVIIIPSSSSSEHHHQRDAVDAIKPSSDDQSPPPFATERPRRAPMSIREDDGRGLEASGGASGEARVPPSPSDGAPQRAAAALVALARLPAVEARLWALLEEQLPAENPQR